MSIQEAVKLETEIYKRLRGKDHFPKLIGTSKHRIITSNCGTSLNKLEKIEIQNLEQQVENIHKVLIEKKITHLDMCASGKNICFQNGKLYLIDFDIAVLDGKPLTPQLKELYEKSLEVDFVKNMIEIVKQKI